MITKNKLLSLYVEVMDQVSDLAEDYERSIKDLEERVASLEKALVCSDPDRLEQAIADVTEAKPRKHKVKVE